MALELQISNLGGPLCSITFASDGAWRGRELKEAIEEKTQIPVSKQKLLYGTTLIRNSDLLSDILTEEPIEILVLRQTVDFDFWLEEISKDYRRLRKAPEELRKDPQVVMEAMNQSPEAIKFAADNVKADRACALKALKASWELYSFIDLDLWDDREVALLFVPKRPHFFNKLSPILKNDREFVMEVLRNNHGYLLSNLTVEMRADREIVLLATRHPGERLYTRNPSWLSWIDRNLLTDKEVVMACARMGHCTVAELPEVMKQDLEVLRALVEGNPSEIVNAPQLREDCPRDLILAMLRKDGRALQFLPEVCDDRECVQVAVNQCCFSLSFASISLRADRDLAQLAIDLFQGTVPRNEHEMSDRDSPHLAPASAAVDGLKFLSSLSKELRSDKALMLQAVSKDGRQLCVVDSVLLTDREVVYAAVSRHPMALKYVVEHEKQGEEQGYPKSKPGKGRKRDESKGLGSSSLSEDVELLFAAVSRDRNAMALCPKHLRPVVEEKLQAKRKAGARS